MSFWDDVAKYANTDASSFKVPAWVANARQTLGTDVEPVYPMKTVHGGNQEPDTTKAPIGYRYDNGNSQYQYLDLNGQPSDLVNRGNLGEAIKTAAPIALAGLGANYLPGLLGGAAAGAGAGSAAPAILTAGSAPGAIAATLPSYLAPAVGNIGAGALAAGAASGGETAAYNTAAGPLAAGSTAPAALTAGAAPGALAATEAGYLAAPSAANIAAGSTAPAALTAGTAAAGATPWYETPTAMLTGASLIGGLAQAASQRQAAAAQSDAAQRALDMQKSIYEQQSALNKPFYQAGVTGQNRLMDLLGLGSNTTGADFGKYGKDFSMSDFQADPGYAFRLAEGQKALDRQAAARGGLISGGAMKAASRYGQDMGSQEYQSAFNRYQTNRANQLQPLGSLMASGQAAANQQSGTLGAYGTNAANLLTQQGTAQAAGNLGTGNTINNMINAGVSAYQNNSLVDQLRRLNPSIYTG